MVFIILPPSVQFHRWCRWFTRATPQRAAWPCTGPSRRSSTTPSCSISCATVRRWELPDDASSFSVCPHHCFLVTRDYGCGLENTLLEWRCGKQGVAVINVDFLTQSQNLHVGLWIIQANLGSFKYLTMLMKYFRVSAQNVLVWFLKKSISQSV